MGALTAPRLWLSRITSSTLIAVALIFAAFDIVFAFDLVVSPLVSVGELLLLVLWARLGIRPSAKSTQSRKARALALGIAALTLLCFVQKGYHLGRFLAGVSALQDAQFYENFTVLTLFFAMVLGVVRGQKLRRFLEAVVPAAEDLGMRLCIHPDDPPRPVFGLPRIVSCAGDLADILAMVDSPANGLTLCSGSLGANPANDVPAIARQFASRIWFAHLRNVKKDPDGSFMEAEHLGGETAMVALIAVLLDEEARRRAAGEDFAESPMRPDHGHEILDDIGRASHPGYPFIGRLRGLAELRGVMTALSHARGRTG